ncbi:hypothetical protein BST22_11790 [Mycolicibacterium chubuense]|jgi:hypothetical protein|uniref:Intersectin-EH binding protein Ibp1 n=1 Tax=Mycolicibacterium chubuense TaxID=1800 RepID=A0A0J6VKN5_MYCCU|nr:hypothetical protein [Mycolicibacterium chubuense]KMO71565.1 hypothetical protein MCHUDSM44219_05194 [Mycolicibacterium chubuense]ORA52686.1 hypothetical protein BST22_11790 [Mycolicibacterium chubuense]SPX98409.1 Uncharacterised protein [Mycolicibacterium chubuense]
MKLITLGSAVLTGAAASLISLAPVAAAQPVPCTDPPGSATEGTPCEPDGAEGPPALVGELPPGTDGVPDVAGCYPGRICE